MSIVLSILFGVSVLVLACAILAITAAVVAPFTEYACRKIFNWGTKVVDGWDAKE